MHASTYSLPREMLRNLPSHQLRFELIRVKLCGHFGVYFVLSKQKCEALTPAFKPDVQSLLQDLPEFQSAIA